MRVRRASTGAQIRFTSVSVTTQKTSGMPARSATIAGAGA